MKSYLFLVILIFSQFSFAQFNPVTMTVTTSKDDLVVKKDAVRELSESHDKLRNPQETMRTFMSAMDRVKSGNSEAFKEAIETLDLSLVDPQVRNLAGKITVERLINTLDRIEKISYAHIPTYENGPKWYFRKQAVSAGENVYDVEIAIAKTPEGDWKFSPETVSTIENFYSSVAHLKVVQGVTEYRNWRIHVKERMPSWTGEEFWILKKGQWIGFLILAIVSLSFFSFVRFFITLYLRFKVRHKSFVLNEKEQYKSTLAFGLLISSLTWLVGIRLLELDAGILEVFTRASYICTAFFSVWSALKVVDYVSLHFQNQAKHTANKFDDVLVPMLKKTSKVLVVTFGILLIAHSLTFDIASILAGLGIGGVAVALAAKDTISNLFGSVTVIIDRPFQIGDYVVLGKEIEGTVEEVGFRSTRLRTPINSLVTLPNSVLANMAIDNFGMRKIRRFRTMLQLEYSTPLPKLQEFCDRIRYQIQLNPMVVKDNYFVTIYELSSSSIDIQLIVFFVTRDIKVELDERHTFILEILKTAQDLGVKLAYPTQTLHLESVERMQNQQTI